jgi:predicted lipoprotein with Yx(FWY)xxD motif
MKRKITLFIAAVAPVAIALVAAGYGRSASGAAYSSPPYGAPAQATAPKGIARAAKIGVASSKLGRILVDARGRSLYLFEKDKRGKSSCNGACAAAWPPLVASGKPSARVGVKASLLGRTKRTDGRWQVTYNRHPLYVFVKDARKGQANGEGVDAFGAEWYLVSPAGAKIENDDMSGSGDDPGSGGYGYGY